MVNISSNFMDEKTPTDFTEYAQLRVALTPDEKGYTGRECPSCERYFKVKFDTGLPTTFQMCPYCGHKDDGNKFFTQDQIKYIHGVAANEVISPQVEKLKENMKSLKHFKPNNIPCRFDIPKYKEEILETDVICDNCGLNFSIYGVFSLPGSVLLFL